MTARQKVKPDSKLRPGIRAILDRTARARRSLDELCAGVELEGGPPELGPPREISSDEARERYRAAEARAVP